jgi:hypothetical protein
VTDAGRLYSVALAPCYPAFTGGHPALQPLGPKLFLETGRIGRPALKEEAHAST